MKNTQTGDIMKDKLKNDILNQCIFLDDNNLNILENALDDIFANFKIQKCPFEDNDVILAKFLNAKSIEGCADSTLEYYKHECSYFMRFVDKNLLTVENNDILSFLSFQKEKGNTAVTLNNKRGVLSALYQWLLNEGYMLVNPLKTVNKVRTPKVIKEHFTAIEIELLRNELYKSNTKPQLFLRNIAIFETLLSSGIRASELCNLNISDVDLTECTMLVHGKGNKERIAYFNYKAQLAIEDYLKTRNDDLDILFKSERGKGEARLNVGSLDRIISNLGKKANIKAHPHKFRHTFATVMLEKGMSLEQVKTTLGHENIKTTQIYAKTSQKDVEMSHRNLIE